ncbi:MAG TPA: KpsF/GutQ family sugar-phosphate isomerase [Candidatus Polarisedimenticolia bacterium]|nr:KpsF/GutQ family sugar-phosphate isomerase [Candidatus Polarisedimenticolia bacterium]
MPRPIGGTGDPLATAREVLTVEARAVSDLIGRLDGGFLRALETIYACKGRVVVTGLGKSGIICRKIAATLASTGTPALFMHPAEAVHGDLGMVVPGDVVLAVSNSGETAELLQLLERIKRLGVALISMTGNPSSTLASQSDIHLEIGVSQEACPMDLVPTASTTASLALGDALAIALVEKRGFREDDFASLHPAGRLGRKVLTVDRAMHAGEALPRVSPDTKVKDLLYEMSAKRLGMTTVCDAGGRLLGIVTDGDLRRLMEREADPLSRKASDVMTKNPVTIHSTELAASALRLMEQRHITSLVVVDAAGRAEGVVHLHDLWRTQLV